LRKAPLARHGLSVFEVPAGHDDIVRPPHNKLLAEYFDVCLDVSTHPEEYETATLPMGTEQWARAGVRLAVVVNASLKE
jgi:hypothetical protein